MNMKARIGQLLEAKALGDIAALSLEHKSVIRFLLSYAYDRQDILTWRAVDAMGRVAQEFARHNHIPVLRDTIRKLLWTMTEESGGIGWCAPDMIGEIVRSDFAEFGDVIPILWSYREEDSFRPGVLWAMNRLAELRPDLLRFICDDVDELFDDSDPQVRGLASALAGAVCTSLPPDRLPVLMADTAPVRWYADSEFRDRTVAEITREASNKNLK